MDNHNKECLAALRQQIKSGEDKQQESERYDAESKRRLSQLIKKKFSTTMIGSLARFEEHFGHLWGHNKDGADLTPSEKKYRNIWDLARTEVLNNGNNQLRGTQDELDSYTVHWNMYQTNFIIKNRSSDNE